MRGVREVLRKANRVNNLFMPQFETLKQAKIGQSAFNVVTDYAMVFKDFVKGIRDRPFRAAVKLSALGAVYFVYHENPDEQSYIDGLIENSNDLLQLSDLIRNPKSDHYIQELISYQNQGRLSRKNFGLFSLITVDEYGKDCDLYNTKCYYLQPRWHQLWKQVVDVGVLRHWYFLEKAMKNYDINEEELANCPPD